MVGVSGSMDNPYSTKKNNKPFSFMQATFKSDFVVFPTQNYGPRKIVGKAGWRTA